MTFLRFLRLSHIKSRINGNNKVAIVRRFCTTVQSEWERPENGFDTGINIYNCVHRDDVPFIVRDAKCVTWYTCGPTVYDDAHIGHAVCYMKCDIIQRILRNHFHLNLITAMNITDIDDKIIARSSSLNVPFQELAKKYEQDFWQDMDALNIQRADLILRVSEWMPQIISFIDQLLAKNCAYVASDGSVYFNNPRANGKLRNLLGPNDQQNELTNKLLVRKSIKDYALWKAAKAGEPHWNVPWTYENDPNVLTIGRPGWHTECAAMATEIFGNTIDLHAGGIDLMFPHHENEESQCCSYHERKQWVNYWLHIGHLVTSDNIKMSKSLKNVITIKEFLKHYSSDQLRMACLLTNYRTHVEFSDELLLDAGNTLKRFVSFFDDTQRFLKHSTTLQRRISNRNEISTCILDLMELVGAINKAINPMQQLQECSQPNSDGNGSDLIKCGQHMVKDFLTMVGLKNVIPKVFEHHENVLQCKSDENTSGNKFVAENLINDILIYRTNLLSDAKANKDKSLFAICDQLRSIYRKNGLIVKDHGTESTWQFENVTTRKNHSNK
ncbi:probable cysteine--tRNA ligase, mitochondrial [Contarinia nasturtii]|uniref:probable cysteine--tRNA ligase, mitochondrial n=1 Tax=Contarinia nasturtii TaxID=265458 RepID=UPI0012D372A9|nr:probable cysteine--tRNA ligase, mitochondrial [Contarinia nasturtii]